MTKTDVTTAKGTDLAESYDYGSDAGAGFEDVGVNDLSIPFISLLQTNSPEVEDQTIEGCKAGDLVNSVTKEILTQPLVIQPVMREVSWVLWRPRNQGGGIVGVYAPDSPEVLKVLEDNNGSKIPPKGPDGKRIPFKIDQNELVETYQFYCLIMNDEGTETVGYCVLSFSSTKIKIQKDWMTSMYTQKGRPPMIAFRSKLSTQKQKAEGGSFFNFKIEPFGKSWRESLIAPNTEQGQALLQGATKFKEMIEGGLAKADTGSVSGGEGSGGSTGGGRTADDDDTPF